MKKAESNLLSISLVFGSLLSVPYLYRIYDEEFDDAEWRSYVRILVPLLGVVASILQFFYTKTGNIRLKYATRTVLGLVLLGSVYYTVFGIYFASSHVCDEIDSLCLNSGTCAAGSIFEVYDTILFISCFFCLTIFSCLLYTSPSPRDS